MKLTRCLAFFSVLAALAAAEPPAAIPPLPGSTPPAAPPAAITPAPAITPAAGATAAPGSVLSKPEPPPNAATPKEALKPPPRSPRFQQVRDRINALFQNRSRTPPPIDPAKNPFRGADAPPPVAAPAKDGAAAPAPVNSDAELLKQGVAQLKMSGFVETKDGLHATINQALYKQGDTIKVTVKGQAVYLRVSKLSRTSLTLTLNAAETTLKF
jgi:hypothetical protein